MKRPGNFQTLLFFVGFILLFFLVFALGVIVGKGLTDFEILLSKKEQIPANGEKSDTGENLDSTAAVTVLSETEAEEVSETATDQKQVKEEAVTIVEETTEAKDKKAEDKTVAKSGADKKKKDSDKKTAEKQKADKTQKGDKPDKKDTGKKEGEENYVAKIDYSKPEFPKTDPGGKYTVQLGSFQNIDTAYKLEKSLNQKGYPTFVIKAVIPEKGTWYRVRVGTFNDKEKALDYAEKIKIKEKLDSTQITLNN